MISKCHLKLGKMGLGFHWINASDWFYDHWHCRWSMRTLFAKIQNGWGCRQLSVVPVINCMCLHLTAHEEHTGRRLQHCHQVLSGFSLLLHRAESHWRRRLRRSPSVNVILWLPHLRIPTPATIRTTQMTASQRRRERKTASNASPGWGGHTALAATWTMYRSEDLYS